MNMTNKPNSCGSTNVFQSQLQQHSERPNGCEGSSGPRPTPPYPAPTARYQDIVRDASIFWEKLHAFHGSLGSKFKVATIGGKSLDLHRLFVEVTTRGGIEKVIYDRNWKEVIKAFNFRDTITSASFIVRKSYLSTLYHFEQVYYFGRQGIPPPTPDLVIRGQSGHPYSSASIPYVAAVNNSSFQGSPAQTFDALLPGTIDVKFDGGYVVTMSVGSEKLQGVLFHVPDNMSQSSHTEGTSSPQNHGEGASSLQSRKRAKHAQRDPSMPKSNRSGYNFFFAENYARLKPAYHGQEKAITQRIGFLWNNLSEAERQVYEEKAMRDKERYRTELMDYKATNSTPNAQ
ncbi:high mobility group B protein 10 [Cajanus cajan]|uniref:high mobility group B protein 10 n=1 Tax=Cajanus cajan TaxID=3821 RepID=UPI00098DB547|nr:high mobility group B protein 10 [Cajanus cajan]